MMTNLHQKTLGIMHEKKKKVAVGLRTRRSAFKGVPRNNMSAPSAASGGKLHGFYIPAWEYFYVNYKNSPTFPVCK